MPPFSRPFFIALFAFVLQWRVGGAELTLPNSLLTSPSQPPKKSFLLGVDANYTLEMEKAGARWNWHGQPCDLFSGMAGRGVQWLRVRLWTSRQGQNGRDYATQIVRRARAAGMQPTLTIFLSDNWADLEKQPAPADWRNLTLEKRALAIQKYARETVQHFRRQGLQSHLYEVGNEIDYGICGVYPTEGEGKDPESLKKRVWPQAVSLILACQRGVKMADPNARFMLHIAHWWDAPFCTEFFRYMLSRGVQLDYAGLSYFPSSNIGNSLTLKQFDEFLGVVYAAIEKPIVIAETAYPATPDFVGQFAAWRTEVPGYSLTPHGQEQWLTQFVRFCRQDPRIAGLFYWSPEWYGEGMWKAFALFDPQGEARPAWSAFSSPPASNSVRLKE